MPWAAKTAAAEARMLRFLSSKSLARGRAMVFLVLCRKV
jgi:hypothetical protein